MPYPIDVFPLWMTILGVVTLGIFGYWVADKDSSARPLGLTALPVSVVVGWCWFTGLPEWTAALVVLVTALLFIVGMTRPDHKDDMWHYSALVIAVIGKLVFWTMAQLWPVFTGQVQVPVWLLVMLVLLSLIGIAGWRSERTQHWLGKIRRRQQTPEAATT